VEGPFRTRTWHGQHPGEGGRTFPGAKSFEGPRWQPGDRQCRRPVDPNAGGGFSGSCRTVDAVRDPNTAGYEMRGGYTLMGAPSAG
jgi:hypothetical protein